MQSPEENKPIELNKLPRFGKAQYTHVLVNKKLYKKWKGQNPEYETSWEEFQIIWDKIAQEIRYQVLNNPDGVRLPFFTGDMACKYVQIKGKPIDEKSSRELGKEVNFLNWHSDKRVARLCWSIDHARKRNKWNKIFAFKASQPFQNEANISIKDHPGEFKVARTTKASAQAEEVRKYNRPYAD